MNVAVINKIVSCYKYLHDIEKEFEYAQKTYNFCCTRSELATYYRNVGWYYLEKYKPEVSVACYMYSNLFEKSEQNENISWKWLHKRVIRTLALKKSKRL